MVQMLKRDMVGFFFMIALKSLVKILSSRQKNVVKIPEVQRNSSEIPQPEEFGHYF